MTAPVLGQPRGGVLAFALCVSTAACGPGTPPDPLPRVEHWQALAGFEYLEVVPRGPGAQAKLPMVVFIHGRGDRPRAEWIEPDAPVARYIMPRARAPLGDGFTWLPRRVGDDDPTLPDAIGEAVQQLAGLLSHLLNTKPTQGRIVLSGFSQGGILSYGLALRHPELVEVAHPVAGWLPPALWPDAPTADVRRPAIMAAHGTDDAVVPMAPTRQMVATLAARGFDIRLRAFEGVGHMQTQPMKDMMESLIARGIAGAAR